MNVLSWLFSTRQGVMVLLGAGLLVFLIVAFFLERQMRKQYFNHEKDPNDDSFLGNLFDDE